VSTPPGRNAKRATTSSPIRQVASTVPSERPATSVRDAVPLLSAADRG
jgi:hypothetical protein